MNANPNAMVSAKGRLFYIYDEAPATVSGLPDLLVFDGQSTFTFQSQRQGGFGGWFHAGTEAYQLAALEWFGSGRQQDIRVHSRRQGDLHGQEMKFISGTRHSGPTFLHCTLGDQMARAIRASKSM